MIRAAAAFALAALTLPGCAPQGEDEAAAALTAMQQLARDFSGEGLCLHNSFALRVPSSTQRGMFVEGPPPAGFELLEDRQPNSTGLKPEELRARLPRKWHIGDGSKEMCFEFTHPLIRQDRALVSVEIHRNLALFGRRNYWLLRQGGGWAVAARTDGGVDI